MGLITHMKTEIIQFNHGELELPVEALEDCHHQGRCDDDVEFWVDRIDWESQRMTSAQIRSELEEHGAWDETELADDDANRERILWIAAGDYQDSQ